MTKPDRSAERAEEAALTEELFGSQPGPPPPGLVAWFDQDQAAGNELWAGAEWPKDSFERDVTPSAMAAVRLAYFRRKVWSCPHVSNEVSEHRPTSMSLGQRVWVCMGCAPLVFIEALYKDDGCCDICDRPTDGFWPFVMGFGPTTIQGDVGDCCIDVMWDRESEESV